MLRLYVRAAVMCPGLPWTVLAGIGTVESGNGTSALPGVHSGTNQAVETWSSSAHPAPRSPTWGSTPASLAARR
ncbi:MAG TPA: hypothetical protein VMV07_26660 [Streptosporangiaceae bacterium]|nr:hypothetical protein [Streptosporangiaceae bacterium]